MAIDFSQVKTITIPEGSVTKITDSNGNTLWQGSGWHTIWEGNKTCSIKMNNNNPSIISGNEENFAQTVAGTGYTPKLRITFSTSTTSYPYDFKAYFYANGKRLSTSPSSPFTIDELNNTSDPNNVLGTIVEHTKYSPFARAILRKKRDKENNRIIFSLLAEEHNLEGGSYGAYFKVTFTITKIEQYY